MADIYINPSATSNGDGTESLPYNSFSEVNAAYTGDMSGDTVYIKRGTTIRQRLSTGASASNYSIKAYGEGAKPIIKASTVPTWTQEGDLWYCAGTVKGNVFIDGEPILTGGVTTQNWVATKPEVVSGKAFLDTVNSRVYIADNPNNGLTEYSSIVNAASLYYPNEVRDIVFMHGYDTALQLLQLNGLIYMINCEIYYGGSPESTASGKNCVEIKGLAAGSGSVICKYNTVKGGENNSFEIWDMDACVFADNITYGSFSNEFELWKNITNSTFERNKTIAANVDYRTRSTHFARLFGPNTLTVGGNSGNTFRNNLMVGTIDGSSAFTIEDNNDNNLIYHNTIVNYGTNAQDSPGAIALQTTSANSGAESTGIVFKNNLISSNRAGTARFYSGGITVNTVLFGGNLWYNTNAARWYLDTTQTYINTLGAWNALTEVGTDVQGDPLLTADYKIESGSPSEGIGEAGLVETDINGYYRYGDQDAGCYQIREMTQTTTRVETES